MQNRPKTRKARPEISLHVLSSNREVNKAFCAYLLHFHRHSLLWLRLEIDGLDAGDGSHDNRFMMLGSCRRWNCDGWDCREC